MGVDVQGDRLEYSVKAWGAGEESWLIQYGILWGDPAQAEVWRQLDLVIDRPWRHESGADLKIHCTAIDSGGHHTEQVYRYTNARRARRVWPVKGVGEPGRAAVHRPASKTRAATRRLWTLGTNALKDIIFARLKQETQGPGYMHFPKAAEPSYFAGLTSEKRVTAYVNGKPVRKYVLVEGKRNEPLDCEQYALAALYILGPVRDRLHLEAKRLEEMVKPAEPAASPVKPAPNVMQPRRIAGHRKSWVKGY
jgi:phage terminase large subunit GpA-like protein